MDDRYMVSIFRGPLTGVIIGYYPAQEARVYDYEASYMAGGSSGALYNLKPLGDAPCAAPLATSDPASQTLQPSARS